MKNFLMVIIFAGLILSSCNTDKNSESDSQTLSQESKTDLFLRAKQDFGVLPEQMPGAENDTPELVELGKKLFFDTRLSVNGTQSCNTCHDITNGIAGVDNRRVSLGAIQGKEGNRNSPTVLNAGFQFVQFWDGREPDLKGQAKGPILNVVEMAMPDEKVVEKLIANIPEYQQQFETTFPGQKNAVTYDNLALAIAAFERTLVSKARYDDYITGKESELSDKELSGMKTMLDAGCSTCHNGPLLGGMMYQKIGLIKPYKNDKDMGRFDLTKNEGDKFIFKVPQLRNIALTYPYFHDGSVQTLDEAIKTMADINLGKNLTETEISDIHSFLKTLTDKYIEKGIKKEY